MNKLLAEALGTFFLIFAGIGAALFAGAGVLGVALTFGLTLMALAYILGPISGCHLNPAVTVGLACAGRVEKKDVIGYVIAQVIGAALGVGLIYLIAKGSPNLDALVSAGFGSNGFGAHSPAGFDRTAALLVEIAAAAMFIFVILGATSSKMPAGFAPIAIGLTLTVGLLITMQVTNGSMNPARATATALVAKGWALEQLWVFWVAPIVGGIVGAFIYKRLEH